LRNKKGRDPPPALFHTVIPAKKRNPAGWSFSLKNLYATMGHYEGLQHDIIA
jgi:hypothetical protein